MSHNWIPATVKQLQGDCGKVIPVLKAKRLHKNMLSTPYEVPDKRAAKMYQTATGDYSAQPHSSRRD